MTDLDLISQRITKLKAELADLETAARVLRNLGAVSPKPQKRVKVSARRRIVRRSQLTITKVAETILSGLNGASEHYLTIAKRASEMGYKGKSTSTPEKSAKAFWATMKRQPDIFEALGEGRFRLRTQAE